MQLNTKSCLLHLPTILLHLRNKHLSAVSILIANHPCAVVASIGALVDYQFSHLLFIQANTYLSSGITGSLVVILWVVGPSKISGAEVGEADRRSVSLAFLRRELEDCFGENYTGDGDEKSERTPRR